MARPTICTEDLINMLPVDKWFQVRQLGLDVNAGSISNRLKDIEEYKQRKSLKGRALEFYITEKAKQRVLSRIKKYGRVRIGKAVSRKKHKPLTLLDKKMQKENDLFNLFMRA